MDKNSIIGIVLIFLLFIVWQQFFAPSPEELAVERARQDSLAQVDAAAAEARELDTLALDAGATAPTDSLVENDSIRLARYAGSFGPFAAAAAPRATDTLTLENDLLKLSFTSKGGRIVRAELKEYAKVIETEDGEEVSLPLYLLEDEQNTFEYLLPIANLPSGGVRTSDLYFEAIPGENSLTFRADAGNGRYFTQHYTLSDSTYLIDYNIELEGLQQVLDNSKDQIQLRWVNHLDKIEKNANYERQYTTTYFKPVDDKTDYCSTGSDDVEELNQESLKWVSNTQQFFTSALIAADSFPGAVLETKVFDAEHSDLKRLTSTINIPIGRQSEGGFDMTFYVGPNEFERLQAIGYSFSDVISFGWSFFGTINRWVIRPLFNFFNTFVGSAGIAILLLTLIVKLAVYPLTYKMLYSQSKMQAMKPYLEKVKSKHKDDQQATQMETMKLYREYGVSPLGGCFPMLLQLPIWFALYRFFPAAITFRQESFLWASDLSTYDTFFQLPFTIPMGFGSHISLFALLWAITTLIYTFYNTRHMDYSAQPAMKYMQYIMPVMFLGFFNSFASGLTCYLLFSNLFNIGQTLVTKNFIINQEKVKAELEANYKKPKKKGGFQARLEEAMKEQRRKQEQQQKKATAGNGNRRKKK